MTRRRWICFVALLAACSSFDPAATSADAGASDGASEDAGNVAASDGGSDAPTMPGCTNHPQGLGHFCDDFDHAGDIGFRWTRAFIDDGGIVTGTDAAFSVPRALVATFPYGATPGTDVWLVHEPEAALSFEGKTRIVFSYMLHVEELALGSSGYFHTAAISFEPTTCPGNNARAVELRFNASGAYVVDLKGLAGADSVCPVNGNSHYLDFLAPHGVEYFKAGFRRVTVEIRREACRGTTGPASVVVDIDGTTTTCRTLVIDPFAKGNGFNVRIGAYAGDGLTNAKARFVFDDAKLDID